MNDTQILAPMLGMMVLTAVVWFVLYARRIPAMRKVGVPTQEYTTPDKGAALLPEAVSYPSNCRFCSTGSVCTCSSRNQRLRPMFMQPGCFSGSGCFTARFIAP